LARFERVCHRLCCHDSYTGPPEWDPEQGIQPDPDTHFTDSDFVTNLQDIDCKHMLLFLGPCTSGGMIESLKNDY